MRKKKPDFITEKHSPVFRKLFYWYTLTLFRRRFTRIWLDVSFLPGYAPWLSGDSPCLPGDASWMQGDTSSWMQDDASWLPDAKKSVLFIGSHNSWWDGLIPLLLNERVFKLDGRAIMDEQQLLKYPFFRRLGTFSINRDHPRKAMKSLDYAVNLMNRSQKNRQTGLWFYPEGKLVSPETPVSLESGLAWMVRRLDPKKCDIIPFAIHMHTMRSDKPELFVRMGHPLDASLYRSGSFLVQTTQILEQLRTSCRRESSEWDDRGNPRNGFQLLLGRPP